MNVTIHIYEAPAVLTKAEAIQQCGGREWLFETLCSEFPQLMKPIFKGERKRGILFLRENLEKGLKILQARQAEQESESVVD